VAATFDELADRLVRQKQERLAFVAAVAHDLRNPLSALKLAGDALQRGPQPPDPERVSRTLAMVGRQVKQLDRMVGDLLDATRVQSGRFELRLQDVDLRAVVQHVAELFRPVSELHRIVLVTPEQPIVVRGDPMRIEQVINNLVSNAIKYSPKGGQVTIAASMAAGAEAVVAVTDEGLGIARDELPHVFEPFHRGAASRELVQGVGLGLAVARRLVEAHGGRLEVESQPGKGSTFRVRLRAAGQAAPVG
jgi:two-component system sensor histidine kinase MtrB